MRLLHIMKFGYIKVTTLEGIEYINIRGIMKVKESCIAIPNENGFYTSPLKYYTNIYYLDSSVISVYESVIEVKNRIKIILK